MMAASTSAGDVAGKEVPRRKLQTIVFAIICCFDVEGFPFLKNGPQVKKLTLRAENQRYE
jgi:hypothetical protein